MPLDGWTERLKGGRLMSRQLRRMWVAFVAPALAAGGAAGLLLGPSMTQAVAAHKPGPRTAVPFFKHVFVIVMENHSYSDIMYEHDLPYIHHLAHTYGLATNYYGITNASTPDRVGLLSGTTANTELPNAPGHNLTQPTIVNQLMAHHMSWGVYYEHSRFSTSAHPVYNYATSSPAGTFFRFKFITTHPALVKTHFHPLPQLGQQLRSRKAGPVPQFVWIRPNSLGNMEGGYRTPGQFTFQGAGPGGATAKDSQLEQGGNTFLSTWIPQIVRSPAWKSGPSAIFIAFDETSYSASNAPVGYWASNAGVAGSPVLPAGIDLSGNPSLPFPGGVDGGGHALAMVITNQARHVVSSVPYNEFSILRTIEKGWHLGYLGEAGAPHVHSMAAFFHPGAPKREEPNRARTALLSGAYPPQLGSTPTVNAGMPGSGSSASASISATSNPYFMEATGHQAASTLIIQEKKAGVLNNSIQLKVVSPAGVAFATRSGPVATTRVANPSATATEFAPSTVSAGHQVTIPVSQASTVPSEVFVTGLLVDVPIGTPAGPVDVQVTSNGALLGTVAIGTVGRPATVGRRPVMMAPIVTPGHVQFPFIPPASGTGRMYTLEIEGAFPMVSPGRATNELFIGHTLTTGPVVRDAAARFTTLAGKEYWARVIGPDGATSAAVNFTAQGD